MIIIPITACGEATQTAAVDPSETVSLQQFSENSTCSYVFPRFGTAVAGTEISIYGSKLAGIDQIRVGTAVFTDFNEQSDTVITFIVPDDLEGIAIGRPRLSGPHNTGICPTSLFVFGTPMIPTPIPTPTPVPTPTPSPTPIPTPTPTPSELLTCSAQNVSVLSPTSFTAVIQIERQGFSFNQVFLSAPSLELGNTVTFTPNPAQFPDTTVQVINSELAVTLANPLPSGSTSFTVVGQTDDFGGEVTPIMCTAEVLVVIEDDYYDDFG